RVSYQTGTIVKKGNGRFLLRFNVRDSAAPTGWRKTGELMKATTEKAAQKERDERMREINAQNERPEENTPLAGISLTVEEFSSSEWLRYLDNKGVAQSTRRAYASGLKKHILPTLGNRLLNEVAPADISRVLANVGASIKAQKSRLNIYTQLKTMF